MSTTSRDYFERIYRTSDDPWSFAFSEYELRRYETILKFVPPRCFRNVFEPGCSIGELTVRLAKRCGFVTAIDIADAAIESAQERCQGLRNVDVRQGALPDDIPAGPFDLIVFSEIGYYFTESQLIELGYELASRIEPRGQLLAAHWTGVSVDHLLTGERVHDLLRRHLPMEHFHHEQHTSPTHDGFVLDLWRNNDFVEDDVT
jgi:SAM-dependent methyltransferase